VKSRSRFITLLWAGTLLVNTFVIGMVAVVAVQNRDRVIAQAGVLTDNYSKILEESLVGLIGEIDITLLTVRDEVARQMSQGSVNRPELEAFLTRQDERVPKALGLRVVDAQGIIRYAINDVKIRNVSIADRPQFKRLRDEPDVGLVFSKPVMGRAALKWMITLGRRIDNADGSFAGDVHVAVSVDQFIELFSKIDLGANGNIGLWDKDTLIARYSRADAQGASVGSTTPSADLHALLNSGEKKAIYHARSGVDGIERTYYFRQVNHYPLYLVVGLADADYLAEWRADSFRMSGLAAMFLAATLASSLLAHRGWKRHEADQETLRRQAAEYTAKLEDSNRAAETARQQSELILTSVGEGLCGVDLEGRIVFINAAARNMLGWGDDEGIGLDLHASSHHHKADGSAFPPSDCAVFQTLRDGKPRQVKDDVFWRTDGTSFPVEFTVAAMWQDGRISGAVNVFRDNTERKELEERITHMALFDELTGLPNRSFLADALQRMAATAQRRQEVVGLLYVDLDGFKGINDAMGHAAGDAVLREVAARMKACLRAEDVVSRMGGDEFLVATLTSVAGAKENCMALADRIIQALREPIPLSEGVAQTGASIGIAILPESNFAIERCIQKADNAMYKAKNAGKGAYVLADGLDAK
jgi:hypothetical protein